MSNLMHEEDSPICVGVRHALCELPVPAQVLPSWAANWEISSSS
jgi:hypothetical protein